MEASFTDQLQTPEVRDLAWVLEGPSLVDTFAPSLGAKFVADAELQAQLKGASSSFLRLDRDPGPLQEYLKAHTQNHRLGNYFETLVAFALDRVIGVEELRFRILVLAERRTLGELDFIFRDPKTAFWQHWEVSVKFYLRTGDELSDCIGTDETDRMDLKLARTLEKQLKLPDTPEAQVFLKSLGIQQLRSRAIMKGILFEKRSTESLLGAAPIPFSESRFKGSWCRFEELALSEAEREGRWFLLAKSRWLSPALTQGTEDLMTGEGLSRYLADHFQDGTSPRMLARMIYRDGAWREIERVLVVRSDFPRLSPRVL